ncbi:hypothetical protein, partial [Glutamicibacter sp. MNS18]|uniref:hypothetical protein n=1 Tax=Glutamicibacter sp. MNS18 TaxID=2989817 RepID=UPI0022369CDD
MTIIDDTTVSAFADRQPGSPEKSGESTAADHQITTIRSGLTYQLSDRDPEETQEWLDSFDSLIESQGTERAQFIIRSLLQRAGA